MAKSRAGVLVGPAPRNGAARVRPSHPHSPRRADVRVDAAPKPSLTGRLLQLLLAETDLAPLGLFRIVYGVLLVNWTWQLLPNLAPFFTDEGMLPRHALLALHPGRLSLLTLVGDWWGVALFWLAGLAAAVMLTVGYRTRLACALAFLVVISFQWRNPLVLDGSDLVFRLVPFWLFFAAAGDRFSVDAAIRRVRGDPPSGRGPALPVVLLQLQVAWIYCMTGLAKLPGARWLDGTATFYVLQLKHTFGRAHAEPLAWNPLLMRAATWGTLAVELAFLPLVFSPVFRRQARALALAGVVLLHLGIVAFMNVGNFPVVMLATTILFLSPGVVHRLVDAARRLLPRARVELAYDGSCRTCRRTVAYLGVLDLYRTISFSDRRADAAGTDHLEAIDERGRPHTGFAALACAGRAVPLLVPLAVLGRAPGLARVGGWLYARLVRHQPLADCPADDCQLVTAPLPPELLAAAPARPRPWWRVPGYVLLTIVALGAFSTALPMSAAGFTAHQAWQAVAQPITTYQPPDPFNRGLQLASLDQSWNMFAPDPMAADGWLLAPARLADGSELDLLAGGPPSDEPRSADPLYSRWAKVVERIADARNVAYRQEFGRMFCRLRNLHLSPGQSPIATFDLYYVQRTIPPPGGEPTVLRHHLWAHTC